MKTIDREQAEKLITGVTEGSWKQYTEHGIISIMGSDGGPIADDVTPSDAALITAAPDLAHTVIEQHNYIMTLVESIHLVFTELDRVKNQLSAPEVAGERGEECTPEG